MFSGEFGLIELLMFATGGLIFLAGLITSIVSFFEKEPVASERSLYAALFFPVPFILIGISDFPFKEITGFTVLTLLVISVIVLFFPTRKTKIANDNPVTKIDERDVMFSRARLKPGSDRFEEYYSNNPDKKEVDDNWRIKAGLCSPGSSMYDKFQFASADASFIAVAHFHPAVETKTSCEKVNPDPKEITRYLKNWGKKLGALEVGITEMKEYHYYSHIGRGDDYGKEVTLRHKYGIAVTVEMDKDMMSYAPAGPTVMESAQQYMNAGVVAMQITEFIRLLGYDARAHIDGNYRVVCPLVARDAGLGEIGRMGLLMTPELGPRVRIAVVTTDLPLVADERLYESSMIDFCRKCKKCADVCPSKSISFEDQEMIDGTKRWQINQESCFDFWCQAGTDCGRCVSTCPYSHPNNLLHNLVRFGIKNSSIFRTFAAKMDDLLYGKIPPSQQAPEWLKVNEKERV